MKMNAKMKIITQEIFPLRLFSIVRKRKKQPMEKWNFTTLEDVVKNVRMKQVSNLIAEGKGKLRQMKSWNHVELNDTIEIMGIKLNEEKREES